MGSIILLSHREIGPNHEAIAYITHAGGNTYSSRASSAHLPLHVTQLPRRAFLQLECGSALSAQARWRKIVNYTGQSATQPYLGFKDEGLKRLWTVLHTCV